jgi:hypothetical protein
MKPVAVSWSHPEARVQRSTSLPAEPGKPENQQIPQIQTICMIQSFPFCVHQGMSTVKVLNSRHSAMASNSDCATSGDQYLLWIDGVGCWLLCMADRVTIGGPALKDDSADIRLMANLSREHVAFQRHGEGYLIQPMADTKINDRPIYEPTRLGNDYRLKLGSSVELGFRLPTALSTSAVIEFRSGHRPAHSVDGIVLMSDNCLLGPGHENHIPCHAWTTTVILFRRNGELCCKSRNPLAVDGKRVKEYANLSTGSVISGEELQFRIEQIEVDS